MKDGWLFDLLESARGRSWLFFSLAIATPAAAYALIWLIGHFGSGPMHGMMALAILILSAVLSISFFVAAAYATYSATSALTKPRALSRQLETLVISAPALAVVLAFLFVIIKQLAV